MPEDLRYRYSTVVFAVVVSAVQLAAVVLIARRLQPRQALGLTPSSSSVKEALAIGGLVVVGTYVLIVSLPFLQGNKDQGVGAPWDPSRALPFLLNAVVLVIVSPVVEELMYRGLGFSLLERFGRGSAILVTALAFAASHGLLVQLPAFAAAGLGLGFLRSRAGSVYPAIVTHAVINLIGVGLAVSIRA